MAKKPTGPKKFKQPKSPKPDHRPTQFPTKKPGPSTTTQLPVVRIP